MTEITAQAVTESLDVLYAAGLLTDAEVAARSFASLGCPEAQPADDPAEAGPFTPLSVTNSLTREDVKAVANEQIVKWHELGGSLLGLKRGNAGLEIANRLHDEGFRSAGIEVKRSKVVVEFEKSEGLDKFSADREALGNLGQGGVVHDSSPSVDDAGAHSVGDGPGVGDASATPATEAALDYLVAAVRDANLDIKSLRRIDDAALANYNESGRNLAKAIKDRTDSERALLDYLTGDQA